MRNVRLDEAQAGIKIAGLNINSLRKADDTTLMAESEEELKSLLIFPQYQRTDSNKEIGNAKTKEEQSRNYTVAIKAGSWFLLKEYTMSLSQELRLSSQVEDGNFGLSRRFLKHCSVTSPSINQKTVTYGTFLVAQGLKLHAPNAGGPSSIPGQGSRSHMLQLNILNAASKMPLVTIKIWHTQISKIKNIF